MIDPMHPIALAAYSLICAALLIHGLVRFRRPRNRSDTPNLDRIIGRDPARTPQRPATPEEMRQLEGHLRIAVLDASARERLVRDAMRETGGDRARAIRKVLADIEADNERYR